MEILYALETTVVKAEKSLFLAGPSPRGKGEYDWRPEALAILKHLGYDGRVYVPLPRDGNFPEDFDHDAQVDWELEHLESSDVRAFWVPRSNELPGFTTNVEYGLFVRDSSRIVLGYPPSATKMRYLRRLAHRFTVPTFDTLETTLQEAVRRVNARCS